MNQKPNKIFNSILIPFLLVFISIFLTYFGMQTQFIDRELDRFISRNINTQMKTLWNRFIAEEVSNPLQRLQWIIDSISSDVSHDLKTIKKVLPSRFEILKNDLYLDYIALFNLQGELVIQQALSLKDEPQNPADFQALIKQGKVTDKIFGIDKTTHGLALKIISPIYSADERIVGYMSAVRHLDDSFFERINSHTSLQTLIFKDDQAIFSAIPFKGEEFFLPKEIQEKFYLTNSTPPESAAHIFIFDTEYLSHSFPFKNLRGDIVGFVMLISNLEIKKRSLKKVASILMWSIFLGSVLILFLGHLISKGITTPIHKLIQATHKVSSGNLNATVDVQSHQELIILSDSFNTMTANLKRTLVSKNYFYGIINTINDLLIIVSPDHSIEFVNQTTLNVLGYTREELIGNPFSLLFKGFYPLKGIDSKAMAQTGKVAEYSCSMITKTGETIPVSFSWAITWDEKKQTMEIVGVARDIRERVEAERKIKQERDKLNTLIEATNDLIFIRNCKGEITFVSHAVEKILGYSPDVFKNLPSGKILSSNPLNHSFLDSPGRWCNKEIVAPYWTEFMTKGGKHFFLEINEAPLQIKNGEDIEIMGIGRDISERKRLEDHLRDYQQKRMEKLKKASRFDDIIGRTKNMQEIYELIKIVSQNNSTVLVKGESGTGKELIAQAIHNNSPRCNFPFIEVTCSVLSEHLLESELFGHVKGAFTGAIKDRPGRFEQAQRGTIFLDEIGDISLNAQIKLLRVLQEREIVRVGGEKRVKVDVRIVAATNKDLDKEIAEGRFREDLYYRLNVVPIIVPPLRERKRDIPLLVEHFIKIINNKIGKQINSISQKAMNLLIEQYWPGNIRQLENVLEYAMIRCQSSEIKARDLSSDIQHLKGEESSVQDSMAAAEKTAIMNMLKSCQWDMTKAAKTMSMGRTTLWRKMKKYGIKKIKT